MKYLKTIFVIIVALHSSHIETSPVFIPDILKPRLPENICFNEALDEGGNK